MQLFEITRRIPLSSLALGLALAIAATSCAPAKAALGAKAPPTQEAASDQNRAGKRAALERRLADLEAAIGELRAAQAASQAQREALAEELGAVKRQLGQAPLASGPQGPAGRASVIGRALDEAQALLGAGEAARATRRLSEILGVPLRADQDARAQLLLGESYYRQRSYHEAILVFQRLIEDHPLAPEVPQALLREAMSLALVGKDENASFLFQKLLAEHPDSPQAAQVRNEIEFKEDEPVSREGSASDGGRDGDLGSNEEEQTEEPPGEPAPPAITVGEIAEEPGGDDGEAATAPAEEPAPPAAEEPDEPAAREELRVSPDEPEEPGEAPLEEGGP